MTTNGQQSGALTPIRSDGINLERLAGITANTVFSSQAVDETHRFWSSNQRPMASKHREIMEVSFGAARLINHLSFKVGRFPLVLQVQYLDANGDWQGVTYAQSSRKRKRKPRREIRRTPVRMTIAESVPAKVFSARAAAHPQHFGRGHWKAESWKIVPVTTRKIRFIFTRNHKGKAPRNHHGRAVAYSVALKHLEIGYRVTARPDIPNKPQEEWWASSKDILGSQTVYSTYEQAATAAIDGNAQTYWRSEPQPFPFAVVNMFLDMRDGTGNAPVIDRFWVDPITTGVQCNLYYSDTVPQGDFAGTSEAIPAQYRTEVSEPFLIRETVTNAIYQMNLGPSLQRGIEVSNEYLRMRYDLPWWVGIDATALVSAGDGSPRPLISLGSIQVFQDANAFRVLLQNGVEAVVPLDATLHRNTVRYRLLASYHPASADRTAYIRLTYKSVNQEPISDEIRVVELAHSTSPVKIGLHPDPESDDVAAMGIRGIVVKSEALTPETEDWFLAEGEAFVSDPDNDQEDRYTSQNARLRMHPSFVTEDNAFGVVGGTGDRFGEMEWTPIKRDYTLRQGFMHVPPTRARYWKFEMTGLLPQVYENFLSIDRDVLVFPPDVVAAHQEATGGQTDNGTPSGVETVGNVSPSVAYTDALEAVRATLAPSDATQVLVVRDPAQAAQVAQNGWIWSYMPWHVGSSAPQFIGTRQHSYESLRVSHSTKVAFFAGIREIKPFRVNYSFDDDTPEYIEHLLDTAYIDTMSGLEHLDGAVVATGASAEIVSKKLLSYREVRGVQFATQETDAFEVLTDSNFAATHLDFWEAYGDANLTRLGLANVLVNRGWFAYSYGDLEERTYGEMDGIPYALLEGNNQVGGYAEGGIISETYVPSGSGKIIGLAKVSSDTNLGAPITVDLVNTFTNAVVATDTQWVRAGETQTITVGYSPSTLTERRTYGDMEVLVSNPTTYGELETSRYFELETATGLPSDVYLRVRQQGATDDSFHVNRMAIYDSPIAWFFSNDDGVTWFQAVDVRNDPYGVLIFPPSDTPEVPEVGRALRWKAVFYKENAALSALHIRPWYGSRARTVEATHGLDSLGPNQSLYDVFPATHRHPMWLDRFNPIEKAYLPGVDEVPFWRNLVVNPSGEAAGGYTGESGTVTVPFEWILEET